MSCVFEDVKRKRTEGKWPTAPIWGEKEGSCGGICRYLKVWCIAKGLRGRTEASCTIGQVSYGLLGEGALDDVRVIAILLRAGGQLHTHTVTYSHAYIQNISVLHSINTQYQHERHQAS